MRKSLLFLLPGLWLFVSSAVAQDNFELEVIVEDVTALPGEQDVVIPIYMKNYSDSVVAFQLWLMLDRPDIMEFQMIFDTAGTLISGWEFVDVNSLGGSPYNLLITGFADMPDPPITPGIGYPQLGEIPLIKVFADAYDIPDTTTERTALMDVVHVPIDHFCFSNPDGFCIGQSDGEVDTTKVRIVDGSLRVQGLCGDVDGSGGIPNVVDLTYLVDYLFFDGSPPPVLEAANVDGKGGINVVDLTYLVDYLFFEGPAPICGPIE